MRKGLDKALLGFDKALAAKYDIYDTDLRDKR